jgi:hypothetical protein
MESFSFSNRIGTGCEILDEDQLGTEALPEAIIGSVQSRTAAFISSVIRISTASARKADTRLRRNRMDQPLEGIQ